jgi:LEA14-like dessication related protein
MRLHLGLLSALFALLAGCAELRALAGVERPRLVYVSWAPEALDLDGVTIALHFRIENPNPVGVTLARLSWALDVEQRRTLSGALPGGLEVRGNGASPLVLPVRLVWSAVPGIAELLLTHRDLAWRVTGAAAVGTPVGEVALPFDTSGRVPMPSLGARP